MSGQRGSREQGISADSCVLLEPHSQITSAHHNVLNRDIPATRGRPLSANAEQILRSVTSHKICGRAKTGAASPEKTRPSNRIS